jgi:aspartate racemase
MKGVIVMEKVIGILGGMGPLATAELFFRIIMATPAKKDQDHLRIIIYNNPKIPDRTEAILLRGKDPLHELVESARALERMGADFIIMPCNTAHYYYEELIRKVGVPILNMIELTASYIQKNYPGLRKVGIIATTGTVKSQIYDRALRKRGIKTLYPPTKMQDTITKALYGIKAGQTENSKLVLLNAINYLIKKGSHAIIIGCTEASLVIREVKFPIPLIDSLQVLAEAAVATALNYEQV